MNIDSIKPTAAVALADQARELELAGKTIIKLQTGDPDFNTHPLIIEAAHQALQQGLTHYSFSQGLPELRDKIAADVNQALNTQTLVDKNWILISNGAAEGIYAAMAAIIEKNDEVIIIEPNWPTVDSLATLLGAKVKKVSSFATAEEIINSLEENYTAHTKFVCFNSPNNPTGQVYSQKLIDAVCNWAIAKDIYILADEVYQFLQFDEPSSSIKYLATYKKYICANSFSKKFAMTGWRVGYVIAHPDTLKKIAKASQLTITHVAPFVQKAALAALTSTQSLIYAEEMKNTYNERRHILLDKCKSLNLEVITCTGGFYLFIKLGNGIDDVTFCERMLLEKDTCIVPGSAFGKTGSNYVRISYATTLENSLNGLERIAEMLNNY